MPCLPVFSYQQKVVTLLGVVAAFVFVVYLFNFLSSASKKPSTTPPGPDIVLEGVPEEPVIETETQSPPALPSNPREDLKVDEKLIPCGKTSDCNKGFTCYLSADFEDAAAECLSTDPCETCESTKCTVSDSDPRVVRCLK